MLSQTFKNVAKLFATTEILRAFLSDFHPSFRFSLERGNFSDIGDASREFSRDLTHGSSFSLSATSFAKVHSCKILHDDTILLLLL